MATYIPAKKNQAYIFYACLVSQTDTKLLQVNPTLAAGDVKIATDDGAPSNITTLPVVDADFTKRIKVSLSAGEMNGDNITVIFSDAAGAEWCDLLVNIQTATNQIDDLTTLGAGAITWTYTLTDEDTGNPIDGAEIWVSTDSAGANVIASGTTDSSGVATFYLDAGTVYVWRKKAGYNFTNPDEETVS